MGKQAGDCTASKGTCKGNPDYAGRPLRHECGENGGHAGNHICAWCRCHF